MPKAPDWSGPERIPTLIETLKQEARDLRLIGRNRDPTADLLERAARRLKELGDD